MKTNFETNNQTGISLLLSVLILSSITAIAFSLATIIFVEIRASGDILRTEPALYATLGVTEEALFQYKRFVPTNLLNVASCAPTGLSVCQVNNVTLQLPGTQPLTTDVTPKVDVVYPGSFVVYPMYAPENFARQYGKVQVSVLPTGVTGSIEVTIRKTDQQGVTTYPSGNPSGTINSTSVPFSFIAFDSQGQYDLILKNTNASTGDAITLSIATYDQDRITAKGLPFFNKRVFEIVASYLGLTRKYTVQIPVP